MPAPVAAYVPAVRPGRLVYTSGQLPIVDGELLATGKVGAEVSAETAASSVPGLAALNALAAVADAGRRGRRDRPDRQGDGLRGQRARLHRSAAGGQRGQRAARRDLRRRRSTRPERGRAWRCCRWTRRSRSSWSSRSRARPTRPARSERPVCADAQPTPLTCCAASRRRCRRRWPSGRRPGQPGAPRPTPRPAASVVLLPRRRGAGWRPTCCTGTPGWRSPRRWWSSPAVGSIRSTGIAADPLAGLRRPGDRGGDRGRCWPRPTLLRLGRLDDPGAGAAPLPDQVLRGRAAGRAGGRDLSGETDRAEWSTPDGGRRPRPRRDDSP